MADKGITNEQAQEIIRRLGVLIVLLAPKKPGTDTVIDITRLEHLAQQAEMAAAAILIGVQEVNMAKKQASESSPQQDLSLLARVFVRYRSGLDITFPECREIIAIFNEMGVDIAGMESSEILATWPGAYHLSDEARGIGHKTEVGDHFGPSEGGAGPTLDEIEFARAAAQEPPDDDPQDDENTEDAK